VSPYHRSHTQAASFRNAIEILDSGFVPADVIVTHQIPLKEIDKAFSPNMKGEAVKTIITV
jgi:Zn-dependent alcohol dehydrogenase